ncbi:riboflavin kinase/FMN adenylyltransferase [Flavobacterium sp. CG_23.5]|uniref:bifunctional riboflavin kinase/FAD synthetase n=1 Tax=unclassified Flavobacterium TaxID=196869 RepID=UPI0018CBBA4F|nr:MULTISPECIES: bifunctional riboflavin kinase/FAD synthetase [unclassified Flavobacterium]MBG6110848.1 riboflavin kinase/FMN adenylyltransferase [Flavobacterium sp. CG_9.10]MBP2283811.1 riboflavin kinase/FMN adenylyltransferase [Flavobacterium sp. CG_23.5]
MKIFHSINDFASTKKTILTLGTFDGVHIGHRKILEKIIQKSQNGTYESLVLTFFPHPRMVLQEHSDIKLLNTIDEKIDLLNQIGIENLVIHPFDEQFSRLTAEEFVSTILVDRFHIQKIIIGHDHRFGRNRTADIQDLIAFGEQYGFEVEQISVQEINEISVSSTKIRKALLQGDMVLANEYLGYEYFLTGIIVKGKQLGRTIGFPTANLKVEEDYKLIPQNGVYIVKSLINNKTVFGMMNIGFNPTVNGQNQTIEVNYFDFNEDLYGQEITVSILKRIRSEQKFESVSLLREQLQKDATTANTYLNQL